MSTPQLRFKGFEGKWQEVKGNNLFDSISDKKHNSDLPILAITQDQGAIPRELINYKVIVSDASVDSYKVVNVGDFIISLRSFQGGIEYSNYKGICSPAYIILRNTKEIHGSFYKIYFKTYNYISKLGEKLEGIRDGKMVSYKYFSEISIPYPSIQEQEKIASFFTVIDQKLNLLKEKKEKLELYKKGMMQQIFSQKLRFKDENRNEFPDWKEQKLGEVTYKTDKKNKSNLQYPIFSINNVKGFVPQSEQFERLDSNDRGYDISLYKIIENSTFAYNPARINVGSLGYYHGIETVIVSSLYVCFKSKEELNDHFLEHFFKTDYFNQQVLKKGEGGVRIYLFFENYSEIIISFPKSLKEQQKIADFLSALDSKINLVSTQIEKTELWKKGLLQQMFV